MLSLQARLDQEVTAMKEYSIAGVSPSDCFVLYLGHSLVGFYPLKRCSQCILQPQLTGLLWNRDSIQYSLGCHETNLFSTIYFYSLYRNLKHPTLFLKNSVEAYFLFSPWNLTEF